MLERKGLRHPDPCMGCVAFRLAAGAGNDSRQFECGRQEAEERPKAPEEISTGAPAKKTSGSTKRAFLTGTELTYDIFVNTKREFDWSMRR